MNKTWRKTGPTPVTMWVTGRKEENTITSLVLKHISHRTKERITYLKLGRHM